jgi:hypothetical protein
MSTIYLFFKAAKVCKANAISKVKKRKNYTSDHRFWGSVVFLNAVKKVQFNNTIDPSI